MRVLLVLTAAALVAGPAVSADLTRDEQTLVRATAGRTAGTPVDCISHPRTDDFQVAGRHLIFRVSPGLTYVNEVSPGCGPGMSRQALVFRSTSSRLCRGEIAQSVDTFSGGPSGGSCTLGPFVPYTRP